VPGNAWTAIDVADVGELEPHATVSVVVAGPDPDGHLPLTLAALSDQTYPSSLTDVVVESGNGTASESALREAAGELVFEVVPVGGAAAAANGDVVLLVPAGSLPERELIEAHARWHHAVADAAVAGVTVRIDAGGLEPAAVREAQRSGGLETLVASRLPAQDEDRAALESFMERTRGLTERRPDLFRVAARGSLSLRAETLRGAGRAASGEQDPELARLDLAYQLDCHGCVFVPERAARSYGPYPEPWVHAPVDGEEAPLPGNGDRELRARAASAIPVRGFRPRGTGRMFDRPMMVVDVVAGDGGASDILDAIDAVLRGRLSDLIVRVVLPPGHPDRATVEAACAADPRVVVAADTPADAPDSPYLVTMPLGAVPADETLDAVHDLMSEEAVGALHVTVPSRVERLRLPRAQALQRVLRRPTMEVVATGARARAERVSAHGGEPADAVLGRLFADRHLPGTAVGLRRRGAGEPDSSEDDGLGSASDLSQERAEHLRYRARAATSQARAERQAQRLFRERLRSGHERVRAERLEARLAGVSPGYWVRWNARRIGRRLAALPRRARARIEPLRHPLYRVRLAVTARMARRRGGAETPPDDA
jgi:hypothetical protein